MKYFIIAIFSLLILGCGNDRVSNLTYKKNLSNYKYYVRTIAFQQKYQAESAIYQINSASNHFDKFREIQVKYSQPVNGKATNIDTAHWADTMSITPYVGNHIFNLDEDSYSQEPLYYNNFFYLFYLEKKVTHAQYAKIEQKINNDGLAKIKEIEEKLLSEHSNNTNVSASKQPVFRQAKNKKVECKVYTHGFDNPTYKGTNLEFFWDGECKDGYAYGLGREFVKSASLNSWSLAVYKDKHPVYYSNLDLTQNKLSEGIIDTKSDSITYMVVTTITESDNDINLTSQSGSMDKKNQETLTLMRSPFHTNYAIYKAYTNFQYVYQNYEFDTSSSLKQAIWMENQGIKNGWSIGLSKNDNALLTGLNVNNSFTPITLPNHYINKADTIVKDAMASHQKALIAQKKSQSIMSEYKNKICLDSVTVDFMSLAEYKDICNESKTQEQARKIKSKLERLTKQRIQALENLKYQQSQQQQERARQQALALEAARLNELKRHNQAKEKQAAISNFTEKMNNMIPKTYNVNVFTY
ncbi:hypothetical protein [Litoribrevibacter albus]|uniref:Lipoprotein n=1 Tax=Litoribrevibacter albus TaxID=1473156 RepID=A0AA37SBR3_9GAMM|nr:hypothetical protein [Litoribrevibacter albus]GLQ33000.1 hypothetical protein GCM10007876_34790 [Litoribrevibacter albus]